MSGPKVTHLTSVHPAHDIRIFHKECTTLAAAGYDVTLVVAGAESEERNGVRIVGVPRATGRLGRAVLGNVRVGIAGWKTGASVIHFHDPELLPLGLVLRALGRKVIYDSHEWVRGDVGSKPYLHPLVARTAAAVVGVLEWLASRSLTHIIGATPRIASQFPARKTSVIGNYPILGEFGSAAPDGTTHEATCAAYVGGINDERCGNEILAAVPLARQDEPSLHMVMAGPIEDGLDPAAVPGIEHVGTLSRDGVVALMARAGFGLALLKPFPNCIEALPNKFFEYLAAGVPTIVSETSVAMAAIVADEGCGEAVDGDDPAAIAAAMVRLARDPRRTREMGERGAVAVRARYNWEAEGTRLVEIYDRITGRGQGRP